ncbi:MAG TPA: beta-galactosidase [Terriglobia bacterium]|nr:beta-galactosidase [Terriglobia bacterium]
MESSRRRFIQSAAASAGFAWSGIRIAAEPSGSVAAPRDSAAAVAVPMDRFLYGSQFYRPPSPPRARRREMIQTIAQEYKFNIVRIWPNWDYVNPEPDKWLFDEVEEVMSYCDEFGLQVLCGLNFELAPWWLEQKFPGARFVDAKGQPLSLVGSPNNVTGGWPGLCFDWEPVREAGAEYIRQLVKVVSVHKSLFGYDCWNEPHIEPAWARNIWAQPQELLFCYCEKTLAAFRDWLKEKYGTLDALNRAWTRRYPNWEAVAPPTYLGTYADWLDWRRFIMVRSTREMQFRVETARAADPVHVMESHAAHHPPVDGCVTSGTNAFRLAEVLDAWGMSLFPRWQFPDIYHGAAKYEITRSNAAGKPFYLTELQAGHGNEGLWRSPKMRPRDIRVYNWLAVALGAKGVIYWNYLAEATGREATGYGLVTRNGAATERSREAAKNHAVIQAHWDIIRDFHPRAEVALLTDLDNALLTYAAQGDEEPSTSSFLGYYKALWNLDLWVDFVEPARLDQSSYKVVIAPWHLIGKRETCDRLRGFVEDGGTLILETGFGLYDDDFYFNPTVPPFGLDEVFGYREGEAFWLKNEKAPADVPASDRVYYEPGIAFTAPLSTRVTGKTYLTPIETTSAKPIATFEGMTVAATKKVGKGQVYYFGTNLGASINAGGNGGIELLRAIITRAVQPLVPGRKVRPRLIEGAASSLLVVFNDTSQDQTAALKLPPRYSKAADLLNGGDRPVVSNAVQITVPYQDALVLLLT